MTQTPIPPETVTPDETTAEANGSISKRTASNGTGVEQAVAEKELTQAPCLCPDCRQKVLDWLRNYERSLDAEAARHQARYHYLAVGLTKHVATHLRRLRRELADTPTKSIMELAQELFDGEVVEL